MPRTTDNSAQQAAQTRKEQKDQELQANTVPLGNSTQTPPLEEPVPVIDVDKELLAKKAKSYSIPVYLQNWISDKAMDRTVATRKNVSESSVVTELLESLYKAEQG